MFDSFHFSYNLYQLRYFVCNIYKRKKLLLHQNFGKTYAVGETDFYKTKKLYIDDNSKLV